MVPFALAIACIALQKSTANNAAFPDVPDNHYVYALLGDMRRSGLLPELAGVNLGSSQSPLTRGQVGAFVVEATINLQRHVDAGRHKSQTQGIVSYSDQISDFNGDQLKYQFALIPQLRRVAKNFSQNLPPFVKLSELDASLQQEAKVIDGLTASP